MKEILEKLIRKENLIADECKLIMNQMMEGACSPAQASAFLVALAMKGESVDEIAALAKSMRAHAVQIRPNIEMLIDTCGTGGDSSNTFNISTSAAFIAAGAGVVIAKHGNRAISGKCGSADVLEQLGVKMLTPEKTKECIEKIGIGFMFAPLFHPTMKNVAGIRRELGIRTVFNILGPLTNPANAKAQLLGVYNPNLTETIANVLNILGTERALVVCSEGLDEIGLGKTKISELKNKTVQTYHINALDFGIIKQDIPTANFKEESAAIMLDVLKGIKGAAQDVALLNAAAVIYIAGKSESIADGLKLARASIETGAAMEKLNALKNFE